MRKFIAGLACALFLVAGAVPAGAELRYTVRVDVTKPGTAATPMAAAIGQLIAQIAPEGSLETVYVVGARGLRAELGKPMGDIPAGTVILWRPSAPGELVLLNPKDKTFTRTPLASPSEALAVAGIRLNATATAPVKAEPILGIATQKSTVNVALELAMAANLPPEARASMAAMQRDSAMTGDVWTAAGRFGEYAAIARKTGVGDLLTAAGLAGKIDGFVLRQFLRVGGHEVRFDVTKITEEAAPAALFEIPAGYTEKSGRPDLNRESPAPKAGALPG